MLKPKVFRYAIGFLIVCHCCWAANIEGGTPKAGFITTPDGIEIHYIEAGPSGEIVNSPTIVFVPGWTMPADI